MDIALAPLVVTGIALFFLGGFYVLIVFIVFWIETLIRNRNIRRRNQRILDNIQRRFNGDL
jgi:hypothetical protein